MGEGDRYLAPLLKFKEELRTGMAVGMTTQGSETAGNVCVLYNTSTQQNKHVISKTFGRGMLGYALVLFEPLT